MQKKVDALGFDRFQIAQARRAYQSNSLLYKKMDNIAKKILELNDQFETIKSQTAAWEAPVKEMTLNVLGIELTSRELIEAHNNPQQFAEVHPELAGKINLGLTDVLPEEENVPEVPENEQEDESANIGKEPEVGQENENPFNA